MWKTRSKILFTVGLGIPVLVFMQMFMYAMYKIFGWDIRLNLLWLCNHWMSHGMDVCWQVSVASGCVDFRGYKLDVDYTNDPDACCANQAPLHGDSRLVRKMGERYRHLKKPRFLVVDKPSPVAFTIGLWRPCIVLSTGLLRMLDTDEEKAVVYHEVHHLWHRDPLKTTLLSVFATMMPYIPVLEAYVAAISHRQRF